MERLVYTDSAGVARISKPKVGEVVRLPTFCKTYREYRGMLGEVKVVQVLKDVGIILLPMLVLLIIVIVFPELLVEP